MLLTPTPDAVAYAVSDMSDKSDWSDDAFVFLPVAGMRDSAISSLISHHSSFLFHLSYFIIFPLPVIDFASPLRKIDREVKKVRARIRGAPMLFADENGDQSLQIQLCRDKLLPSSRKGNPQAYQDYEIIILIRS